MKALAFLLLFCGGAPSLWGTEHYDTNRLLADPNLDIPWVRLPVEGFTQAPSFVPGDIVQFMISTRAGYTWNNGDLYLTTGTCWLHIYRVTSRYRLASGQATDQEMTGSGLPFSFSATFHPLRAADGSDIYPEELNTLYSLRRRPVDYRQGCTWWPLNAQFQIPSSGWPSGFYYAKVTDWLGQVGYIPFVLKRAPTAAAAPILCVIAWNTYQAYNFWGGGCLYPEIGFAAGTYNLADFQTVSFRRPFTDFLWDSQITTPLGQFDHRERHFV